MINKIKLRAFLIKARNFLHPSNNFKISSRAICRIQGNMLSVTIDLPASNALQIGEGARLRHASISCTGKGNKISIGSHSSFKGIIELRGDNNIVEIGSNTRINGANIYAHNSTRVLIGDDCLFSIDIDLRTTDSHSIFDSNGHRINPDKDIRIMDNVWIGRMVSVLKGSIIEKGTVVGSMSLVAGRLPANAICAGNPAKMIRHNISWG